MHRVYVAGASATPPAVPESQPNPNHYPAHAAIFDPYTAHAIIEEICNVILGAGLSLNVESTTQLNAAINAKIAAAGVGTPTGAVLDFAGETAPSGFLMCDGQAVSRTTYANLFAVIGTTYGAGDSSTTFNVPDARGRFRLGKDNMGGSSANRVDNAQADILGGSGGSETHTLTQAEMPAHSHTVSAQQSGGGTLAGGTTYGANQLTSTSSVGGGGAHNNMPPYITLNAIIKT